MRLRGIAANFGVLDQVRVSLTPGQLHLIVDANERGKSTLVAAIVAAVYGFASRNERDRWAPRSTSRFEVALEIEAAGRALSVRRNFHTGSCIVRDLTTQREVTDEFQTGKSQWNVGRVLLGLNREQFLRSALIRQGEVTALGLDKEASLLTTRIQQLVDTTEGDHTAAEAIGVLDDALRSYEGVTLKSSGMVRNEVKRLSTRIREVEEALIQLRRRRSGLDAQAERMGSARAEAARLRADRGRLLELASVADAHEAMDRLRADDDRRSRAATLERRRGELASVGDLDHATVDRLVQLDGHLTDLERSATDGRAAREKASARLAQLEALQASAGPLGEATAADVEEVVRLHEGLRRADDDRSSAAAALDRATASTSADSADLARRFGLASPADLDELSRHYERRHALVTARVPSKRAGSAASAPVGPTRVAAPYVAIAAAFLFLGIGAGFARWWFVAAAATAAACLLFALSRLKTGQASRPTQDGDVDGVSDANHMELGELDRRAASVAIRYGFDDVEAAVEGLRSWERLERHAEAISAASRSCVEAQARRRHAASAASAVLARWNRAIDPEHVTPGQLDELHGAMVGALQNASVVRQARQEIDEIERKRIVVEQERGRLGVAFSDLSVAPAASETDRRATLDRLRHQLALLDERRVIDGRLREIAGSLLDESRRARLVAIAAKGASASDAGAGALGAAEHDRAEADALVEQAKAVEEEAHRLELSFGAELDDFERRYPALEAEHAELRRALARAEGFEEAVALARDALDDMAHESHRDWAARLNAAASEALTRFGSPHADLRFGEDLDFVVTDRTTGEQWSRSDVERSLSVGARDQVYLAVRMALTSFFSTTADPVPLVFDDSFATSDDARFVAAMDYLAGEARRRQVIVLTCHERRHRWWLDQSSARADRVQWVGLATTDSTVDMLTTSFL